MKAALLIVLLSCTSCAGAAQGDLAARIARAAPGSTITLNAHDYGALALRNVTFAKPVRIDAAKASFTAITMTNVQGVQIVGGQILGSGGRSRGIDMRNVRNVRIENMAIIGARNGILITDSSDVALVGNRLERLIDNGIAMALSRRILVERNICRGFTPQMSTFDAQGKKLIEGDHADCIQGWSRPTAAPTADITVIGNIVDGAMQGISFFNHVRNGVDDGGFDRIVIRDNRVRVGFGNGVVLNNGRDSVVTGNQVDTMPGAVQPRDGRPIRATLRVDGTNNRVCGNRVSAVPNNPGNSACGG